VLIFDEVVTGFRVAPGGAQELYNVTPAQYNQKGLKVASDFNYNASA